MNRMPITVATRRRATRWAAVSLSAIALPLAVLSAPVAIQSARAHLSSRTVEHWGSLSGGVIPIMPVDTILSPAPVRLPGPVAEVATSNSTESIQTSSRSSAFDLAESGVNNSMAILNLPTNNDSRTTR